MVGIFHGYVTNNQMVDVSHIYHKPKLVGLVKYPSTSPNPERLRDSGAPVMSVTIYVDPLKNTGNLLRLSKHKPFESGYLVAV